MSKLTPDQKRQRQIERIEASILILRQKQQLIQRGIQEKEELLNELQRLV